MSRSLKSALAMTTKVCHFGSDDKFYRCHEAGRLLLSITDENQAYLDPHASAAGIPPFKRTEHLSPAYSGLSRHQTLTFCKRHQVAVNIAWGKPLAVGLLFAFPEASFFGFIFLATSAWLTALWYHLLTVTLSHLVLRYFIWHQQSRPKVSADVGVSYTTAPLRR